MLVGIGLIFLLQWTFLGDLRSALIVATTIPFALFFAIIVMIARGESANMLSVGAIDFWFGRRCHGDHGGKYFSPSRAAEWRKARKDDSLHGTQTILGLRGKFAVIANSATQVNRAIFFSAAIIIAGFVPLFTMGASRDTSSAQWRGLWLCNCRRAHCDIHGFTGAREPFTPQSS